MATMVVPGRRWLSVAWTSAASLASRAEVASSRNSQSGLASKARVNGQTLLFATGEDEPPIGDFMQTRRELAEAHRGKSLKSGVIVDAVFCIGVGETAFEAAEREIRFLRQEQDGAGWAG